ncbi:MAG: hypothetical protein NC133_03980 [Prevotella sp.]|nr:hypothetical protein [Prevotella sp.]
MKNLTKRIATLATALTLVVVLGFCLSACGGSKAEMTMADCQKHFTDAGYATTTGENVTKFVGALDNADEIAEYLASGQGQYMAQTYEFTADDVTWMLQAADMSSDDYTKYETAYVVKFNSEDKAKDVTTKAQAEIDASESASANEMVLIRDGKLVIMATSQNIANIAQGK